MNHLRSHHVRRTTLSIALVLLPALSTGIRATAQSSDSDDIAAVTLPPNWPRVRPGQEGRWWGGTFEIFEPGERPQPGPQRTPVEVWYLVLNADTPPLSQGYSSALAQAPVLHHGGTSVPAFRRPFHQQAPIPDMRRDFQATAGVSSVVPPAVQAADQCSDRVPAHARCIVVPPWDSASTSSLRQLSDPLVFRQLEQDYRRIHTILTSRPLDDDALRALRSSIMRFRRTLWKDLALIQANATLRTDDDTLREHTLSSANRFVEIAEVLTQFVHKGSEVSRRQW